MSLPSKDFPQNVVATLAFGCSRPLLLEMREAIALLTALAADRMRRYGAAAGKVTVWMETSPECAEPQHREQGRAAALPIPIGDARLLALFTRDIVDELYRPGHTYRKAGVSCEELVVDERASASFDKAEERVVQLARVMDCIRERYGQASIVIVNEGLAMRRWQSIYSPRGCVSKLADYTQVQTMCW